MEGYKTIAYEIVERFDWRSPDRIVMPVAFGDGFYGAWKGFREFKALGLIPDTPRMTAAEPFGPLTHALRHGLSEQEPVPAGESVAYSIATPLSTYQAWTAIQESQGDAITVDDEQIMAAQAILARQEGLFAEASSTTALAAVKQGLETGRIHSNECVCVILTSSGLKDPATTAKRLPPVPEAAPTLADVLEVLEKTYGFNVA